MSSPFLHPRPDSSGQGTLLHKVVSPEDYALNDPFIMLTDDNLDIRDCDRQNQAERIRSYVERGARNQGVLVGDDLKIELEVSPIKPKEAAWQPYACEASQSGRYTALRSLIHNKGACYGDIRFGKVPQ